MKISIIIPVFNEKNSIEEIIKRVQDVDVGLEKEIIIVDDCSQDGTRQILEKLNYPNMKLFFTQKTRGKEPHYKLVSPRQKEILS